MIEVKSSFAKASEDILRRRVAPFLQAKKIYAWQDWLAIRSFSEGWWILRDLNPRPSDYESPALTTELRIHIDNLIITGTIHQKCRKANVKLKKKAKKIFFTLDY